MSWSENRSSKKAGAAAPESSTPTLGGYDEAPVLSEERVRQLVASVDGLLAALARDEDFHDDLATPSVQKAMKHWTGECRLSPEEAQGFEDDFRVMAVLRKIAKLQQACRALRMGIPMDHVTCRRSSLAPELVETARSLLTASLSSTAPARVAANIASNMDNSSSSSIDVSAAAVTASKTAPAAKSVQSKAQKAKESARSAPKNDAVPSATAPAGGGAASVGNVAPPPTTASPQNGSTSGGTSGGQTNTNTHGGAYVPSEAVRRTADKEPLLRTEDYRNMVLGFIAGFALAVLGFVVRKYVI